MKSLFRKETQKKDDFSEFFHNASAKDKKKLMLRVIRNANREQKNLMKEYSS